MWKLRLCIQGASDLPHFMHVRLRLTVVNQVINKSVDGLEWLGEA